MKIYDSSRAAAEKLKQSVVTLGVFDGVHRGHQRLLALCRQRAQKIRAGSVAYTFEPHPVRTLFPEACPHLLTTTAQKLELIGQYGIGTCVVERFTKRFSQLTPEAFFRRILVKRLKARELVVGYDFTFGAKRRGTIATLQELGQAFEVKVHIIDAFLKDGHLVSSTVARQQIHDGEVGVVQVLLGRPYFIDGTVVAGDGLGRQLGFPTANLQTDNELLPAKGVYATRTRLAKRSCRSVTNIGTRPTFRGTQLRIETHILNFNQPIKGRRMRLEFLKRLRPERTFGGPAELISQIKQDISQARRFFARGHS